jgi:hypothetical protein
MIIVDGVLRALGLRKVYFLRKDYDRVREKADRIRGRQKRLAILLVLDKVEPTLVMLEEQRLRPIEKKRMMLYVKKGVYEAKLMTAKNYVPPYQQREGYTQRY